MSELILLDPVFAPYSVDTGWEDARLDSSRVVPRYLPSVWVSPLPLPHRYLVPEIVTHDQAREFGLLLKETNPYKTCVHSRVIYRCTGSRQAIMKRVHAVPSENQRALIRAAKEIRNFDPVEVVSCLLTRVEEARQTSADSAQSLITLRARMASEKLMAASEYGACEERSLWVAAATLYEKALETVYRIVIKRGGASC